MPLYIKIMKEKIGKLFENFVYPIFIGIVLAFGVGAYIRVGIVEDEMLNYILDTQEIISKMIQVDSLNQAKLIDVYEFLNNELPEFIKQNQ